MRPIVTGVLLGFLGGIFLGSTLWAEEASSWAENSTDRVLDTFEQGARLTQLNKLKEWLNSGPARFQPYLKQKFQYDANVFKEPERTREATVWTFTPGVGVQVPFEEYYRLGLVYEGEFEYFTKFAGALNEQTQNFGAVLDASFPNHVYLKATESFADDSSRSGSPDTERVEYIDNTASARAGYKFEEWRSEVGYQNFGREYRGDLNDRFSYLENRLDTLLGREMKDVPGMGESEVFLEYHLGHLSYDETPSRNGGYHEITLGIRGKNLFIQKLSGNAKVGWHKRTYDFPDEKKFNNVVTDTSLSYQLFDPTKATFGFIRKPQEATFSTANFSDDKIGYASLTHLFTSRLRARTTFSLIRRHFRELTRVGTKLLKRRDGVATLNLGLDYSLRKWLMVSLDYDWGRQNSNLPDFDSTNNVLSASITMPF